MFRIFALGSCLVLAGAPTYLCAQQQFTPIAMTGDAAPGQSEMVFKQLNQPEIDQTGAVAFRGIMKRSGSYLTDLEDGVFEFRDGVLETVFSHEREDIKIEGKRTSLVSPNIQVTDTGAHIFLLETLDQNDSFVGEPGSFVSLFNDRPYLADEVAALGRTALYDLDVAGDQMIFTSFCYHASARGCDDALFQWDGKTLRKHLHLFDVFDLMGVGQSLLGYSVYARVNRRGQVLVSVINDSNEETGGGLYLVQGETWKPLHEEPVGTEVLPLMYRNADLLALTDDGQALYVLSDFLVGDDPSEVLFQSDGNVSTRLLSADDVVLPSGWSTFGFGDVCMNSTGTIAFTLLLSKDDPEGPRNAHYGSALYAMRKGQEPQPIVATGDTLDLPDRGATVVARVNSITDKECALNDLDQLAIGLNFGQDVSGIFRVDF